MMADNATANGGVSNTTESLISESEQTLIWKNPAAEELVRLLHIVIRRVLIVFGTIGNSLSFYIMRQGSLKKMSTCFYLSILALADTSKCYFLKIINKSIFLSQSTIMLSRSFQGESSVLRVRLRVVKIPLQICTSPL